MQSAIEFQFKPVYPPYGRDVQGSSWRICDTPVLNLVYLYGTLGFFLPVRKILRHNKYTYPWSHNTDVWQIYYTSHHDNRPRVQEKLLQSVLNWIKWRTSKCRLTDGGTIYLYPHIVGRPAWEIRSEIVKINVWSIISWHTTENSFQYGVICPPVCWSSELLSLCLS